MPRLSSTLLLLAALSLIDAKNHEFNFKISRFNAAPDGFQRSVVGVNGQYPAPPIVVTKGDTITVNVRNELATESTSLHAHGFFQRGTPWYDGVSGVTQCPIGPTQSFTYQWDTTDQVGTTWYHAHTGTQYMDGLVGPLIIKDPQDPYARQYDDEVVVMLSDWYHRQSDDLLKNDFLVPQSQGEEPVPSSGLINGKGRYDCTKAAKGAKCNPNAERSTFKFAKGKRYRLRLINTSAFAAFQFSIDSHKLKVIGADMTAIEPEVVDRLNINVAQRYDVIVEATQAVDNYWMRATMVTACMPDQLNGLDANVVAVVRYEGAPNKDPAAALALQQLPTEDEGCIDLNAAKLRPLKKQNPPAATKTVQLEIDFGLDSNKVNVGLVNGQSFIPRLNDPILNRVMNSKGGVTTFASNQNVVTLENNEWVDIVLTNKDDGEHPFHLHGHDFYVLEWVANQTYDPKKAKLNTNNPVRRDTSTLPKLGYTVLRFKADNPGTWTFHCHIDWHNAAGLVVTFNELPQQQKAFRQPADAQQLCRETIVPGVPPSPRRGMRAMAVATPSAAPAPANDPLDGYARPGAGSKYQRTGRPRYRKHRKNNTAAKKH